jgi:hypothetical protein
LWIPENWIELPSDVVSLSEQEGGYAGPFVAKAEVRRGTIWPKQKAGGHYLDVSRGLPDPHTLAVYN